MREELILQSEKRLEIEKDSLEAWLTAHSNPVSLERIDKKDVPALQILQVNQSNHSIIRERLEDVNAALARISDGTFAICQECKNEIPEERILIMPFVNRCLICQKKVEEAKKYK